MSSMDEDDHPLFATTTAAAAPAGVTSLPAAGQRRDRPAVAYALFALIPLAALAALVALLVMAGNAAAATGGCGGG